MVEKNSGKNDDDTRKELLKELRSLLKDIPEEGLLFLIKQANTILYNMRVEELNKAKENLHKSKNVSTTKKEPKTKYSSISSSS